MFSENVTIGSWQTMLGSWLIVFRNSEFYKTSDKSPKPRYLYQGTKIIVTDGSELGNVTGHQIVFWSVMEDIGVVLAITTDI